LKEYDYEALHAGFCEVGFRKLLCFMTVKGRRVKVPYHLLRTAERTLLALPPGIRANLALSRSTREVMGLDVIGIK
jgi:hypothetical protein